MTDKEKEMAAEIKDLKRKLRIADKMNSELFDQNLWLGKQIRQYEILGAKKFITIKEPVYEIEQH